MGYRSKKEKELLETLLKLQKSYDDFTKEEIEEFYLNVKGANLKTALMSKRSKAQTWNWKKYRFKYESGIKRYHNLIRNRTIQRRDSLLSGLVKGMKKLRSFRVRKEDPKKPKEHFGTKGINEIQLDFNEFEKWRFCANLNMLKSSIMSEVLMFHWDEEVQADYIVFVESVVKAFTNIECDVLNDKVVLLEDLEVLAVLLEDNIKNEWNQRTKEKFILNENDSYIDKCIDIVNLKPS